MADGITASILAKASHAQIVHQTAVLLSHPVEGPRRSGGIAEERAAYVAGGDISANAYFEDDGLSHPEDICASGIPGAIAGRVVSDGCASAQDAIWFRQAIRRDAVLRGSYSESAGCSDAGRGRS